MGLKKQHKVRVVRPKLRCASVWLPGPKKHVFVIARQDFILSRGFLFKIRRRLKKYILRNKVKINFRFTHNYTLSSKGKNMRMGKGVGTINRVVIKIYRGATVLHLTNIHPVRLRTVKFIFQKYFPTKFIVK